MPNALQVTLVLSASLTFLFLLAMSNLVLSQFNLTDQSSTISNLSHTDSFASKAFHFLIPSPLHNLMPTALPPNMSSPAILAAAVLLAATFYILSKASFFKRRPVLDPQEWKEFPLQGKIIISPNTALYRFALEGTSDVLGLPIGQHISVAAEIDGKEIVRSYTPTSSDDNKGHFDLIVKTYEKGNISRYLSLIKVGQKVRIKGPKGQFKYSSDLATHIGMIAGGTGITPMLQIIRAALKNSFDGTKLSLIYANVNEDDILLKKELDTLAESHPQRFKVYYVLNTPPSVWDGGVGFVSKEQIELHLPPTQESIKILLCGPPPMMTAMKKHLAELKYPAPRTVSKLVDQVFIF